jgi:hypothetical protein
MPSMTAPAYAEPAESYHAVEPRLPPITAPTQRLQPALPTYAAEPTIPAHAAAPVPTPRQSASPAALSTRPPSNEPVMHRAPAAVSSSFAAPRAEAANAQHSIVRIHEACQAPPLSPPEYRTLFEAMASEIAENGLSGQQTVTAITQRAQERGIAARREDVRFVLDVVSEADPWFEQGASANLFAGRFRNFVVARCREQGLRLSADELDMVDAWFAGGPEPASPRMAIAPPNRPAADGASPAESGAGAGGESRAQRWWAMGERMLGERAGAGERATTAATRATRGDADEDMPRFVRTRQRG